METIMSFVVTLVTMLIMMTAIEVIAPDNSIKKYLKFVLGLILIVVMLSPIISIISKGEEEILNYLSKYEDGYVSAIESDENIDVSTKREEVFRENLEGNCKKILKDEFEDKDFEVKIKCSMNLEKMTYLIEHISVGVKNKGVNKVQKIIINTNENEKTSVENIDTNKYDEIKEYLIECFQVQDDKIDIYNLE